MIIFVQEEVGGGGAGRVEFARRMAPEERGKEKGKNTPSLRQLLVYLSKPEELGKAEERRSPSPPAFPAPVPPQNHKIASTLNVHHPSPSMSSPSTAPNKNVDRSPSLSLDVPLDNVILGPLTPRKLTDGFVNLNDDDDNDDNNGNDNDRNVVGSVPGVAVDSIVDSDDNFVGNIVNVSNTDDSADDSADNNNDSKEGGGGGGGGGGEGEEEEPTPPLAAPPLHAKSVSFHGDTHDNTSNQASRDTSCDTSRGISRGISRDTSRDTSPCTSLHASLPSITLTSLSSLYTFLASFTSLSLFYLSLLYLLTSNSNYYLHYMYCVIPLYSITLIVALFSSPLSSSRKQMLLLKAHFVLSTIFPCVTFGSVLVYHQYSASPTSNESSPQTLYFLVFFLLLSLSLFTMGLKTRNYITVTFAEPSMSRHLHNFMKSLFLYGSSYTFTIVLLTFESLKCFREVGFIELNSCRSTITSQTFLGLMIGLIGLTKILTSLIPKHILKKHEISNTQLATLTLTTRNKIKVIFIFISLLSGMYMLGTLGTVRESTNNESFALYLVGGIGLMSLFAAFLITCFGVVRDLQRNEYRYDDDDDDKEKVTNERQPLPPTSLSPFYMTLAYVCGLAHSITAVYFAVTDDDSYLAIARLVMPINILLSIVGLFSNPTLERRVYLPILFLHMFTFVGVSFAASSIGYYFRLGEVWRGIERLILTAVVSAGLTKLILVLRSYISKLPPPELSSYLINTVLSSCLKLLGPLLFLAFRSVRCVVEEQSIEACVVPSTAQSWLSAYFIMFNLVLFVTSALPASDRHLVDNRWSISKIVLFDLSTAQKIELCLAAITAMCSLALFSVVLSPPGSWEASRNPLIYYVGIGGAITVTGILASEIGRVWLKDSPRVPKRFSTYLATSSSLDDRSSANSYVTSCSWIWFCPGVVLSILHTTLIAMFVATSNHDYWVIDQTFSIITYMTYILGFALKPRANSKLFWAYVFCHYLLQILIPGILRTSNDYRKYDDATYLATLTEPAVTTLVAAIALKVRHSACNLSDFDLDSFIRNAVVKVTVVEAMGGILYLLFEALACIAKSVSTGYELKVIELQCSTQTSVTQYLSGGLCAIAVMNLASKSMPPELQSLTGLTVSHLATMTITLKQKIQAVLFSVAAICMAMMIPYLGTYRGKDSNADKFAVSGVIFDPSFFGAAGLVLCGACALIEISFVAYTMIMYERWNIVPKRLNKGSINVSAVNLGGEIEVV
jgi:hypothetical protein